MPLKGGAADKFGNRYEGRWTALQMAAVLDERYASIRLEPPDALGEGVEFWLRDDATRSFHQVKRQHTATGRWSLSDLSSVLPKFWQKLNASQDVCVFVSMHDAYALRELSECSKGAATFDEFENIFLAQGQRKGQFDELCQLWGHCDQRAAFDALKRVDVRTLDERTLREHVNSQLSALVDANPSTAADVLAQLALDSVHQELSSSVIWHHLASRGMRRRELSGDSHLIARVQVLTQRYSANLRDGASLQQMIERDEVSAGLRALTGVDRRKGILFSGSAGTGKSFALLQLIERLPNTWPVLAFRVDLLNPTPDPAELGKQLGLPDSPAVVLAGISAQQTCALVIDQLDSISLASGRNPQFFNTIRDVLRQAEAYEHMRLILGCRSFDLQHDARLRNLLGDRDGMEEIRVGSLSAHSVSEVLSSLDVDSQQLNLTQRELLRLPLHLGLFIQVCRDGGSSIVNFKSVNDLFGRFWDYKQDAVRARLGSQAHWIEVVDGLLEYMNRHQTTVAPEDTVAHYRSDALAMASEHVLTHADHRFGFFHDSFFDYCYARRVCAANTSLIAFLRNHEQHLFRRAQLRQLLLFRREQDPTSTTYLTELGAILRDPGIRFHLKQVALALLGACEDPTPNEWDILSPFVITPDDPVSSIVWGMLRSQAWFRMADSTGAIESWLTSADERLVVSGFSLVWHAQSHSPKRATELVARYVGVSDTWNARIRSFLETGNLSHCRTAFDLCMTALEVGLFDDINDLSLLHPLATVQPQWAAEAIGSYLRRRAFVARSKCLSDPFDRLSGLNDLAHEADFLLKCATRAPIDFLRCTLPFILATASENSFESRDGRCRDRIWSYRHSDAGYSFSGALLMATSSAVTLCATTSQREFSEIADRLLKSGLEVGEYLLMRGYLSDPKVYADQAACFLINDARRLSTGYAGATNELGRKLVAAITPCCSAIHYDRLESTILQYWPDWERTRDAYLQRRWGSTQHELLSACCRSRLSASAMKRLQEWDRKFGQPRHQQTKSPEAHFVGPPIPVTAAHKLTDAQWLSAIALHSKDCIRWDREEPIGGALELSRLLENETKLAPRRFARLAPSIPDAANSLYFEAILRGLAEADIDQETLIHVIRRCHALPSRPCGREICRVIEQSGLEAIQPEILEVLSWYGSHDPDPRKEVWRLDGGSGHPYYGGDIFTAGMNSTRGAAAMAIAHLIERVPATLGCLRSVISKLCSDPSIAVRSCAAAIVSAIAPIDDAYATELFFDALCDTEDVVLKTPHVENFLWRASRDEYYCRDRIAWRPTARLAQRFGISARCFATMAKRLHLPRFSARGNAIAALLERMSASTDKDVVRAGARVISALSLNSVAAEHLSDETLHGPVSARLGAAEVFSAQARFAQVAPRCDRTLAVLFSDPNDAVRKAAASAFRHFERAELGEHEPLVKAFIQSRAFHAHHRLLLEALDETTAPLADCSLAACEAVMDLYETKSREHVAPGQRELTLVSHLVVRLYAQNRNGQVGNRCLDVIDRLVAKAAYAIQPALAEHDR